MIKSLLLGISLSLGFSQAALPETFNKENNQKISLPTCYDSHGKKVSYRAADTWEMRKEHVGVAMAFQDASGMPIIKYDTDVLLKTPYQFTQHALSHECAHHKLGHLYIPYQLSETEKASLEKKADCNAVKVNNFTARDVEIIGDAFKALYPSDPNAMIKWEVPDKKSILMQCLKF